MSPGRRPRWCADWPETTKRWQDGILQAQQKNVIRTHGASVHGLPALRQMPGVNWLDVLAILIVVLFGTGIVGALLQPPRR